MIITIWWDTNILAIFCCETSKRQIQRDISEFELNGIMTKQNQWMRMQKIWIPRKKDEIEIEEGCILPMPKRQVCTYIHIYIHTFRIAKSSSLCLLALSAFVYFQEASAHFPHWFSIQRSLCLGLYAIWCKKTLTYANGWYFQGHLLSDVLSPSILLRNVFSNVYVSNDGTVTSSK